jgi:hypothetical protein
MLREEVIARAGEAVAGGRASGSRAFPARPLYAGLDPSIALQLKQLLPDRFSGELQGGSELGDGGRTGLLERQKDRAAAVGKLVDG